MQEEIGETASDFPTQRKLRISKLVVVHEVYILIQFHTLPIKEDEDDDYPIVEEIDEFGGTTSPLSKIDNFFIDGYSKHGYEKIEKELGIRKSDYSKLLKTTNIELITLINTWKNATGEECQCAASTVSGENTPVNSSTKIKSYLKPVIPMKAMAKKSTKAKSRNTIKRMASEDHKSIGIRAKLNKLVTELECQQNSDCSKRVLLKMQIDNMSRYLPFGTKKTFS